MRKSSKKEVVNPKIGRYGRASSTKRYNGPMVEHYDIPSGDTESFMEENYPDNAERMAEIQKKQSMKIRKERKRLT